MEEKAAKELPYTFEGTVGVAVPDVHSEVDAVHVVCFYIISLVPRNLQEFRTIVDER